jgi:hypothetical protein
VYSNESLFLIIVNQDSMKVVLLILAWTGTVNGWVGSASFSCTNLHFWSFRSGMEGQSVTARNTVSKRSLVLTSICRAELVQTSNMANRPIVGQSNVDCMKLGLSVLSRRSCFLLSLPLIFGAASSASADVQLTYGSGSFSGSSVVNGVLSAYGLPQLPDTKGFTPFLSQYQVRRYCGCLS